MTAPLSTKHRNSANITYTQCAAMLKVKSSDLPLLIGYGLALIPAGKAKRFNVGRILQWCADHPHILRPIQEDYRVAREIRLATERARQKEKRIAGRLTLRAIEEVSQ